MTEETTKKILLVTDARWLALRLTNAVQKKFGESSVDIVGGIIKKV